jgi:hypothetical protein
VLLRLRLNLSSKSFKRSVYKAGIEVGNKHEIKQAPPASLTAAANLFPTTKAVAEAGLEEAETYSTSITVFYYRQMVQLPVSSEPYQSSGAVESKPPSKSTSHVLAEGTTLRPRVTVVVWC